MTISTKQRHFLLWAAGFVVILIIVAMMRSGRVAAPSWIISEDKTEQAPAAAEFNKQLYSLDDPASFWLIVNKQRAIPAGYSPPNLRQPAVRLRSPGSNEMLLRGETATATEEMVKAATAEGINLMLVSGYRSYGLQQSVYGGNVARQGQAEADKTSARPGHSEHQTGLAADFGTTSRLCELETCFDQTPEGRWLAAHAHEFGFVIRYPNNQQAIVGYTYEPWHLRYVGPELAPEVHNSGQTLEQFFGLPNAPNY